MGTFSLFIVCYLRHQDIFPCYSTIPGTCSSFSQLPPSSESGCELIKSERRVFVCREEVGRLAAVVQSVVGVDDVEISGEDGRSASDLGSAELEAEG